MRSFPINTAAAIAEEACPHPDKACESHDRRPLCLDINLFNMLDTLDSETITSQRQLAERTGMSLGKVNSALRRLMENKLVRLEHHTTVSRRFGNIYRLTGKGTEVKSKFAATFFKARLKECSRLRSRLEKRLISIQVDGPRRVVVVGPEEIKNLIAYIVETKKLKIDVVGHYPTALGFFAGPKVKMNAFDLVLIFDSVTGGIEDLVEKSGLSAERFLSFW
jgi:DNA-binding MarR family transcriptional regulator